jgi:hypothetical protein
MGQSVLFVTNNKLTIRALSLTLITVSHGAGHEPRYWFSRRQGIHHARDKCGADRRRGHFFSPFIIQVMSGLRKD